jgi:hypothetical protein
MEANYEELADRVSATIKAWGEEVTRQVRTNPLFALQLQAKFQRFVADAMPSEVLPAEDQLTEDDRGKLLMAAIIEVIADVQDETGRA